MKTQATLSAISEKIREAPREPGVYLFKGAGEVLYVGKAGILRDRLRAYLPGAGRGEKVDAILARADDLEWIVTHSDVEALVLEFTLVHKYSPRYNVELKDGKRFPYLRITVFEPFPRFEVVREIRRDGAKYYGPYVEAGKMRKVLKVMESVFQIRTCDLDMPQPPGFRPCLSHQLRTCEAPCIGAESAEAYAGKVKGALLFLSGRGNALIDKLSGDMAAASAAQNFERAAKFRDDIEAVRGVLSRQRMRFQREADFDAVGLALRGRAACAVIFWVREGMVVGRHHFFLRLSGGEAPGEVMESFLEQRYRREIEIPPAIFLSALPENFSALERFFSDEAGVPVRLKSPQQGDMANLVATCVKNANLLLNQHLLEKESRRHEVAASVEALQSALGLPRLPMVIEAYDISHFQGSQTVASQVTFVNGNPKKSRYRRYAIRTVEGVDDFSSMSEVVGRRVRRFKEEGDELPDLFLIDGGKGQLGAAAEVLRNYGLEGQPLASLAKRLEEIFVPGNPDPVILSKRSPALRLLQRLRDEAHRFAVGYHRQKRTRDFLATPLDGVRGLGEKRKRILLAACGSAEAVFALSDDQLKTAGIPATVILAIRQHSKEVKHA